MKLFYHHVGIAGSKEDFPKTVFNRVPQSILNSIPETEPYREDIIQGVQSAFPEGHFNCWGVPSGAVPIIGRLEVGDAVLLVERFGEYGNIPALGIVLAFWTTQLRDLSRALWGEGKYPYVFFFNTERLDLTWEEFREDVGFKPNYNPRGKFYSVVEEKLNPLGGANEYINHLRKTKGVPGPK